MARPKTKPTGRPRTQVSEAQWKQIERMATAMCTHQEIADYLGIGKRTLYEPHIKDRFMEITKRAAAKTRLEVREKQLRLAKKGQPVGSIWWGKQHLGQTDRNMVSPPEGGPLDQIQGAAQRLADVLSKLAKKADADAQG